MTSDEIQGKIQEKLNIFRMLGVKARQLNDLIIYESDENTETVVDILGNEYCTLSKSNAAVDDYLIDFNTTQFKANIYKLAMNENVKQLSVEYTSGVKNISMLGKFLTLSTDFSFMFISDESFEKGEAIVLNVYDSVEEIKHDSSIEGLDLIRIKHTVDYKKYISGESVVVIKDNKIHSITANQKYELPSNRHIMRYINDTEAILNDIEIDEPDIFNLVNWHKNDVVVYGSFLADEKFNKISDIYEIMWSLDQYIFPGYIGVINAETKNRGYIDINGKEILPVKYESIQLISYRYAVLKEDNQPDCIFDFEKKIVVQSLNGFDYYEYYSNRKLKTKHFGYVVLKHKNGQKILLDSTGKTFDAKDIQKYYDCYTCDKYDNIIAIKCKYEMNFITNTGKIIENPAKISELNRLAWSNMDKNDDKIKKLFNI